MDYPGLLGPEAGNYSPNLIFIQEESPFPMAFYSAMIQESVMDSSENLTQISEDFLVTEGGKDYFRWQTVTVQQGVAYQQVFYFFESGDWKLVVIYTRLRDFGSQYDDMVDEAMSTVRFKR
jgi:hypothetical protein